MEDNMGILAWVGCLLIFVGYIWLIITGFKVGGALWGILNIFFQPITGLIFCVVKKAGWQPFLLMVAGIILAGIGGGAAFMSNLPR
jgi:hypothetical protein